MNKSILAVVVVLALALGALAGVTLGMMKAWQAPAVVAQIARQESARADELQAKADEEKARAAAAGAWARTSSELAIEWARRWPVVVVLVLVVVGLAAGGSLAAWLRWAWLRSTAAALPGGLVVLRQGPALVVIDPARTIGGIVRIDDSHVVPVLQTSEELAADVARAALVAAAVQKVGGSESRAELAARVTESLSSAFQNLASSSALTVGAPPQLRLVKVRSNAEKKSAALIDDTAELREFVEVGAARGFQRREWAGYKFKSTGRPCSQTRWATLAGWLKESELLSGHALVCDATEALQRLGYEVAGGAGESESAE